MFSSHQSQGEMLHKLPIKEVPNKLIISSDSITLIDAVGEGNPVPKLFVITYRPVTLLTKICDTMGHDS